ncbi:DUF4175 family protein [Telluribacter sp. SYSU D00476]|uniref:DUF4175 family protein n=1 Tax=Telluribacter sp. SYSU D00476 TaxID=2811430 RepID=UPI001FF6814B|nr:DUF4175 family protein [Telluribacter sp. SYSU D00476]
MAASTTAMASLLFRIQEYRQKYYQNQLLKGIIFSAALLLSVFLFVNTLEYFGRFSSTIRGMLFFGFMAVLMFSVFRWIIQPLISLYGLRRPLSDEEAALQIGQYFPEVGDKLINTLQLRSLTGSQTDLIEASIQQKSNQLLIVRFSDAIRFQENQRYVKYAVYPLAAIAMILMFHPSFFTTSSDRIIHFQNNYTYAPFSFHVENKALKAFRNDDYTIRLKLEGEALPKDVYLVQNGTRFKLTQEDGRMYSYTFKNVQRDVKFGFEAAGFTSNDYTLTVIERPSLLSFDVHLRYPAYLNKPAEGLNNVGNLTVPEGTVIEWDFNTSATKSMAIRFDSDSILHKAEGRGGERYQLRKQVRRSSQYQVMLQNDDTPNAEAIGYYINVIPDRHPELSLENFQDTTLYNYMVMGGSISDDYGFSQLRLFYTIRRKGDSESAKVQPKSMAIPFNKTVNTQSFYFQWYVDSLKLTPGDRIEYYAQVWDNDGINGSKSARSRTINFTVPSKDKLEAEIQKSAEQTQSQLEKTLKKAKSLEQDMKNLENRLKSTKEMDFQERKQAEDIIKKREELMNEIKSIQEQNKSTNEKSRQFNQQSPEMQQKLDQLQKLMNELMDDETSKLFKELQKLLEQKQSERMANMLEKLRNKNQNTEKEIERALNLFKKLQMEQKMENVIKDLDQLAEKEEKLAEKTQKTDEAAKNEKAKDDKAKDDKNKDGKDKEDKKGAADDKKGENDQKDGKDANDQKNAKDQKSANDELKKEQEKIKEEFEKAQKDIEDIEKMSKELDEPMDKQEGEQKNASEQMKQSMKQLDQKQNKSASESQKKAAKSMRNMSKSMSESMQSSQMSQMQEDIDSMRDILENLIELSFDQERLMKDFKGVNLQDPRFVKLGQEQLKLQDDAKVIEDSLYALANRVIQIQSFITRELNDMKTYMGESVSNIRDRRINVATSKQQFAMTSMNNLALMLSDVFRQMQQQMAMAMQMPGSGKEKGKQQQSPGMGEMQKQLNERIQQLSQQQRQGQQGQQGKEGMSEELARTAAEQARLRKMIQELIDSQKGTEMGQKMGNELKEIMEKMDESETDLVNKRINQELIKRNQEIVTRLLESEKAMREQDEDEKRKGETAKEVIRRPPPAFEQYIKEKERQTELLRSIPPTFSPFYKREVDAYFRKYQAQGK